MTIEYNMKTGLPIITGEMNEKGQYEIIETFLRRQIGAGEDTASPARRDKYRINLSWNPDEDQISVSDDIGNKSLRDGILIDVLGKLEKGLN